ncbi:MAG: DsrE family protein [Planctomycetes bacterium]|nr:DsrE family protein [Planctomycetota bacterium]
MKLAIFVLSNPGAGEEGLGRLFNALALAAEAQRAGDDVHVVFAGAGTRWPAELTRLDHPAHALYSDVRPAVQGASCGCAAVFGATESVEACGVPSLGDNPLPGTPGVASIRRYVAGGWHTLVF